MIQNPLPLYWIITPNTLARTRTWGLWSLEVLLKGQMMSQCGPWMPRIRISSIPAVSCIFWLVVGPPLWKIWVRQLGWWDSQLNGKIKNGNQTTNQILYSQFGSWCLTRLLPFPQFKTEFWGCYMTHKMDKSRHHTTPWNLCGTEATYWCLLVLIHCCNASTTIGFVSSLPPLLDIAVMISPICLRQSLRWSSVWINHPTVCVTIASPPFIPLGFLDHAVRGFLHLFPSRFDATLP